MLLTAQQRAKKLLSTWITLPMPIFVALVTWTVLAVGAVVIEHPVRAILEIGLALGAGIIIGRRVPSVHAWGQRMRRPTADSTKAVTRSTTAPCPYGSSLRTLWPWP